MKQSLFHITRGGAAALLALACSAAGAQTTTMQPTSGFIVTPVFQQWVATVAPAVPAQAAPMQAVPASVPVIPWTVAAPAQPAAYQARPVILGQPDLPLVGPSAQHAAQRWDSGLNYQGVHMKLVALTNAGLQARPMSGPLLPGERFKIRVTATFEAVAELDKLSGDAWSAQRVGQIYPAAGTSVQLRAGETVDLPLGDAYFVAAGQSTERLVLSVRHPRAIGAAASSQPAYRMDGATGSNYLQLTPAGMLPLFEQVIATSR
jgi:hypothetical protein